jgi:hypothetical protein
LQLTKQHQQVVSNDVPRQYQILKGEKKKYHKKGNKN